MENTTAPDAPIPSTLTADDVNLIIDTIGTAFPDGEGDQVDAVMDKLLAMLASAVQAEDTTAAPAHGGLYEAGTYQPTTRLQALTDESEGQAAEPTPAEVGALFAEFTTGSREYAGRLGLREFGRWVAGTYHEELGPCEISW